MEPQFWRDRWASEQIGFHCNAVHPALERFWAVTAGGAGPVLVPLCGKSLDLRWLAGRGHAVTGVELAERAVRDFFSEWGIEAAARRRPDGLEERTGGGVTILVGDWFAFRPGPVFEGFHDRAALVALPAPMRRAYLERLASCCAAGATGLLVTFEYDPAAMDGPPFPVMEDEVRDQPWFAVERLAGEDVTGRYPGLVARGLGALQEVVYRLERKGRSSGGRSGPGSSGE